MARTGVKTPPPTDGLTAGGAIFSRLKTLGVDVVFANAGTDFPPIIEGLADAKAKGIDLPLAIPIPHEHAAMGMAHGYYLMTGRPMWGLPTARSGRSTRPASISR